MQFVTFCWIVILLCKWYSLGILNIPAEINDLTHYTQGQYYIWVFRRVMEIWKHARWNPCGSKYGCRRLNKVSIVNICWVMTILWFRSFCAAAILNFWESDGCYTFETRFNEFLMVENVGVDILTKSLSSIVAELWRFYDLGHLHCGHFEFLGVGWVV